MGNEKKISFKNYIVAIETEINNGTAFFIAPNLLCTAYHVIEDAKINDITVKWQGKDLKVVDYSKYEEYDLVFLETENANNLGWFQINSMNEIIEGNNYNAFGYPDEHRNDGSPLLVTYTGSDKNGTILTFSDDNITPGYSGCPVYSINEKCLIGMIEISRDVTNPSGGRALSAYKILELLCNDNKIYQYSILMLGKNELYPSNDFQWTKSNKYILSSFYRLLNDFFENKKVWDFSQIMCPFLNAKGYITSNLYLEIASLLSREYREYLDCYRAWLIDNQNYDNKKQIDEALHFLSNMIFPLPKDACIRSEEYFNNLCRIPIAGSRNLRLNELFDSKSNLLVPFNLEIGIEKYYKINIEEIYIIFGEIIQKSYNIFILSNAGLGKSTFSVSLFKHFLNLRITNQIACIPVYVDLQQENTNTIFDKEWLYKKISPMYGEINILSMYGNSEAPEIILIMDGLDEYLSVQSKNRVKSFFESPIFNIEDKTQMVITCRKFFYENYIRFNSVAAQFYNVNLLPWTTNQKEDYISQYLKIISDRDDINQLSNNIKSCILNNTFLRDISGTPLYLNMSIEVLYESEKHRIDSIVDLYEQYTNLWIRNEYNRNTDTDNSDFMIEEISLLLPKVSWEYFKKYGTQFTKKDILDVVKKHVKTNDSFYQDYEKIVKFIMFNTFLITENNNYRLDNIKYVHKSFFEFFVSKYIFSILSNPQSSALDVINAHMLLIPHEISEMIKEFFLKNNLLDSSKSKKVKRIILNNCKNAIKVLKNDNSAECETIYFDEQRISSQQIMYHIGQVTLNETTEYLKEQLKIEKDLWTKRTIILGLSFSGDSTELNDYIMRMRRERENDKEPLESNVNIGFSLSFFGDQPFDDEHPEIDQGLPKCRNTVITLINQLSTERNRPSWKNDIYTLVDLASNRKISELEYNETIRENKERLLEIINKLKTYDSETQTWVEIKEMQEIIDKIENCNVQI